MEGVTLIILIILTIINLSIYHKFFRVVYFSLGEGLFKEIFLAFLLAIFEFYLLGGIVIKILGFLGGVVRFILKLALIILAIGLLVFVVSKIVELLKAGKESREKEGNTIDPGELENVDDKAMINSKYMPIILGTVAFILVVFVLIKLGGQSDNNKTVASDMVLTDNEDVSYTMQETVNLSQFYTNESEGISFYYPSEWVNIDTGSEFTIVRMIDLRNNADNITSMEISYSLDSDPFGVYTQSEAQIKRAVNELGKFLGFWDMEISGIPAKSIMYQTEGLNGEYIEQRYWYTIGDDVYQIICSYSVATADVYKPIFEAVMESYTISTKSEFVEQDMFVDTDVQSMANQIFEEWRLRHPISLEVSMEYLGNFVDAEDNSGKYYVFDFWYGDIGTTLYVNLDTQDMIMDYPEIDDYGNCISELIPIDQWYLEKYWGWTYDSTYYSEYFENERYYIVYDERGRGLFEYHEEGDYYIVYE